MSQPTLQLSYTAAAAIPANRFVKLTSASIAALAVTATDAIMGASVDVAASAGERMDVMLEGVAFIEAGAAVAVGAPVTSDSIGRAVTAAPAAGANVRLGGFALEAAVAASDIIRVKLGIGFMQG